MAKVKKHSTPIRSHCLSDRPDPHHTGHLHVNLLATYYARRGHYLYNSLDAQPGSKLFHICRWSELDFWVDYLFCRGPSNALRWCLSSRKFPTKTILSLYFVFYVCDVGDSFQSKFDYLVCFLGINQY